MRAQWLELFKQVCNIVFNIIYIRGCYYNFYRMCDPIVPSAVPTNFKTVALSPYIVLATWYEPPFSEQNGILTKYELTWNGLERDREVRIVDIPVNSSSNTSYALDDLDAYTSYEVNVSSFTSVGAGPISSVRVTTLQDSEYNFMFVFISLFCIA